MTEQPLSRTSDTCPTFNQGWLTPQLPQRQDSLEDQLRDVVVLANRAGCYDAADAIRRVWFGASDQVEGALRKGGKVDADYADTIRERMGWQ